ncbi:hypothetical protein [uncultured Pelagimonas sp.]|uniref:hypothetical protein n=1 Tax=uncultured Pelagimonas sp. TaxID=1618102 RepID=UPI00260C1B3D|nr:hypothetical protein [uncultured Pelagimonas sp.]
MPSFYKFYPHNRIAVIGYLGEYTAEESLKTIGQYLQDPQYDPDFELVLDLTEAESTSATFFEMEKLVGEIASKVQQSNRNICVVIAVTDLLYGAARMYQQLMQDKVSYPIEIVRNRIDALALLGLEGDSFESLDHAPNARS